MIRLFQIYCWFTSLQNATYTITVVATDNGQPKNFNSTTSLVIIVFPPDNFFSPVLDETTYQGTVDENTASGVVVVSFTMTDGDQFGPASELNRVILSGSDNSFFEAEITGTNTGVIRTT